MDEYYTSGHVLPSLFRKNNGELVADAAGWRERREEIRANIVEFSYGGMPPVPESTVLQVLNISDAKSVKGSKYWTCRVMMDGKRPFSFILNLFVPAGEGPFPVVINGDGCWRYAGEEVVRDVLSRNYILAQFNRTEIVPDVRAAGRELGLYKVYPEGDYGALSAWAWGYHRCIDALGGLDFADMDRIGITGHSRGGKTVLLAAATDERVSFVAVNNSGAGGAGCYRHQGAGSEHLKHILGSFDYWFGPRMPGYIGRERELPFDQHFLKALVAPRFLLTQEALADVWANPSGTWLTHLAAREAYKMLGAEDRIAVTFREGGHAHGPEDWRTMLDVMDWSFFGKPKPDGVNAAPFPDPPRELYDEAPAIF